MLLKHNANFHMWALATPEFMGYTHRQRLKRNIVNMSAPRNLFVSALLAVAIVLPGLGLGQEQKVEVVEQGDVVQLKPDYPTRYTVVKGDTLWDIASRFLRSPWHWPKIWTINEQIANPHLIYPGDVLVLRFVEGRPQVTVAERAAPVALPPKETETAIVQEFEGVKGAPSGRVTKLSPRVVSKPLTEPIPTISPEIILPFLTKPLVVDDTELKQAGYVTIGLDDRIALGDQSEFYARGVPESDTELYQLFRKGKRIKDPDTKKKLGYEAIYLGDARLLTPGDPAKFIVTRVKQEILPSDNLLIAPARAPLPYFFPRAPDQQVRGRILTALNAVEEMGTFSVVSVNLGSKDGLEPGHVLRILRSAGRRRDPVTRKKYQLPDEPSGLLMVFRTFDQVSYGLIINSTRPVNILDAVVTP